MSDVIDIAQCRKLRDLAYRCEKLSDLIRMARFRGDEKLESEASEQLRALHRENVDLLG
jgi:hypothetical protein